jgi:hypothetical protein
MRRKVSLLASPPRAAQIPVRAYFAPLLRGTLTMLDVLVRGRVAAPLVLRFALAFALALALALSLTACEQIRPPSMPDDPGPPEPVVEYVAQQEILTPLPMRVRLPARYGVERVLVFVHFWGTHEYKTYELPRLGRGQQTWEGEISCRAVSTVTGDTRYYFLALNADGQPVIGSGSPEWPHVATIVRELEDGPQALSGRATPNQCHDPADCPPDFQGCPRYTILRPACHSSRDCLEHGGRCAWDGYCEAPPETEPDMSNASEDELLAAAVRKATKRFQSAKASVPVSAR